MELIDSQLVVTKIESTVAGSTRTVFTAAADGNVAYSNTTFTNKMVAAKIRLLKIGNGSEENPLANAQFKLYSDEDCSKQITTDSNGQEIGTEGLITTDENGGAYLGFFLPGNYYLKETKSPAGYGHPNEVITILVNENGIVTYNQPSYIESQQSGPKYDEATDTYTLVINNTSGTELPHTGGIGTMPYTLGGLALALGALGFLLETRRRQRRRGDAAQ